MAYMNIEDYATIFKCLSDKTRLRIMNLLIKAGKGLCVCEIMDSLSESQYNISRHLKELKIAGLIKERKYGRWVSYSLTEAKGGFQRLLRRSLRNIPEEVFLMDNLRLKERLSLREGGKCVIGLKSSKWEEILTQLRLKGGREYVEKT